MPALLDKEAKTQLILGMQWGDEGKGKVVDLLGENVDVVARFQGGPNAGHTVVFDGEQFILHIIPTGILRPHIRCYIGNGVVINPDSMLKEIAPLEEKGIDVLPRLLISHNAHLILPYHLVLDRHSEEVVRGEKIGTTGRGIGPAYADKISRVGIRVGDLTDWKGLVQKVEHNVRVKNLLFEKAYGIDGVNAGDILDCLSAFYERIKTCIGDTTLALQRDMASGKRILLEGAQGMLLDIDFGTYPYVTSSNTMIGGISTGLGVHPRSVDRVIGILKAYTTRVGNGPFPTELEDAMGEKIREMGGEYGATTGRPRRCGWFDGMIARYAVAINGIDTLAVTKLDVLDELDEISICTGYLYKGEALDHFPTDDRLAHVEPLYETLPGWKTSTREIRQFEDLPQAARDYLERMQKIAGVPAGLVSVGPGREETIWME